MEIQALKMFKFKMTKFCQYIAREDNSGIYFTQIFDIFYPNIKAWLYLINYILLIHVLSKFPLKTAMFIEDITKKVGLAQIFHSFDQGSAKNDQF